MESKESGRSKNNKDRGIIRKRRDRSSIWQSRRILIFWLLVQVRPVLIIRARVKISEAKVPEEKLGSEFRPEYKKR
jgi:hypothetical protein